MEVELIDLYSWLPLVGQETEWCKRSKIVTTASGRHLCIYSALLTHYTREFAFLSATVGTLDTLILHIVLTYAVITIVLPYHNLLAFDNNCFGVLTKPR